LIGNTPQEQLTNFVTPAGMYVKPRWGETGSFSGLWDKKPRVEISDVGAKIIKKELDPDMSYKLKDILEHPVLYNREPWMKDIDVYPRMGSGGEYKPGFIDVGIGHLERGFFGEVPMSQSRQERVLKTLLHEGQHGIQDEAGWAIGGTPAQFSSNRSMEFMNKVNDYDKWRYDEQIQGIVDAIKNKNYKKGLEIKAQDPEAYKIVQRLYTEIGELPTPDVLKKESDRLLELSRKYEPFNQYRNIAGEAESRDTTARRFMTMKERRSAQPLGTQNIPLEEMIVKFK
jgi:hypothetical protein